MWCWELLPNAVHDVLAPIGGLVNPGHTTGPSVLPAGPDTVAGVAEIRAEGFTPIEEVTGRSDIALVWPEAHRRSVAETRPWWIDDHPDGRLWMVRSPWQALTLEEVLSCVWTYVERDRDQFLQADESAQLVMMGEVLAWSEPRALEQLAIARSRHDGSE